MRNRFRDLGAITGLACALAAPSVAVAAPLQTPSSNPSGLEEVTIIGIRDGEPQQVTGSAQVIDQGELEKFAYSDIQRIIRQIPGVSVQIEDGYGLRPNLSIRGVATERSARITLLEDGVLIAPAPYSAPSAYYFPTSGRMSGVEVLKGPSAITQGPYTIGGAINLISTPIPGQRGGLANGLINSEWGSDDSWRVHATYGGQAEHFGYLLETHQWQSDGFQTIDRDGGDTGLDKQDYTVKLRFGDDQQSLSVKLQRATEESQQSYLGLTDADFSADAYRRYGLSALDNIDTTHRQAIVRYDRKFADWQINATAYNNTHQRDWFKTEGIDLDGSADARSFERTSWANVIDAVNRGNSLSGFSANDLQAILDGGDTAPGSIQLRSNAREYFSRGIQFGLRRDIVFGTAQHELEFGLRYHEDQEDRLQRNSSWQQSGGALTLDDVGQLGNAGNRLQDAQALAAHVHDRIEWGSWIFSPGIRYERVDQQRVRYQTDSDNPDSRADDNIRDRQDNQIDIWLPGFGAVYQVTDSLALVGGVHKGFTTPGSDPDARAETAWNYELGLRLDQPHWQIEAIAFHSDYDNLLGVCTASSGADCEIGDSFNGNAATVSGLELQLNADLLRGATGSYSVPLSLTYTYSDGEFDTDIANTDFFGDVSAGDPIPYIPSQQLSLRLGLEAAGWASYLSANYVDEVCTRASCDPFERTDAALVLDWSGNYQLNQSLALFGRLENLTGATDIMGRQPYGARPNKDRTATVGFRLGF